MKTQKKLTNEELASFCSQVAVMLKAGITPIEGLRILLSDTDDPKSKNLLQAIIDQITEGNSFAESLTEVGVFPNYVLNTLKLGEEAGNIDEVMESLADYYELGNTSEYYLADVTLINQDNVEMYRKEEDEDE